MQAAGKTSPSNGAKLHINNDDSVRGRCKQLTDLLESAQQSMREYKKEVEMLRQEIGLMENHLSTQNDENVKVINPFILQNFEDLQTAIRKQHIENEHMQKQIVELRRDKAHI